MNAHWNGIGLGVSAAAHALLFGLALFWGALFQAPDEDPIQVVEAAIISEDEFASLIGEQASAPTRSPQPRPEDVALAAPEPEPEPEPAPEPEPEPAEAAPEPEPAATPAPYDVAPAAPSDLALDPRAVQDESADRQIREALPPVRAAAAPEQPEAATPEATPEVERQSDEPPAAEEPEAQRPRPRIAEAPAQPEIVNRDRPPEPDTPDAPPTEEVAEAEPEPDPEPKPDPEPTPEPVDPVAALAPDATRLPRMRPARLTEAPSPPAEVERAETPPEPEEDDFFADLDRTLSALDQTQRPQQTPQRRNSQRTPSRPLSAGEKAALAFNFKRYWSPPTPGPDLADLIVTLDVAVGPDGALTGPPRQVAPTGALTPRQTTAIFNAMRAVRQGAPYQGPADKYDRWRMIRVTYDPILSEATIN